MKLTVTFPGIGYHVDKPILYFAKKIAKECGYDKNIDVNYTGFDKDIKGDSEGIKKAIEHGFNQAEEILKDVDFSEYEDIVFLTKSIGTAVANLYARKHGINCRIIYYTPLAETFMEEPMEGIAFSGTNDPWADIDEVSEFCRSYNIRQFITNGVNHSMEGEDTLENIAILKEMMDITKKYLER